MEQWKLIILKKISHHFNAKSFFWDVALDVLLKNWKKKKKKRPRS